MIIAAGFNFARAGWALCQESVAADLREPDPVSAHRHDVRRQRVQDPAPAAMAHAV
jgi:hypothetical protein